MSRHCFSNIVKNTNELITKYDLENGESEIEEPCDIKGYGLSEWFDQGVVGWDEPMGTYFIQCIEEGDELVWWLGTTFREIQSFEEVCMLINKIFENTVDFEFVDVIKQDS